MTLEKTSSALCHGGTQDVYSHHSDVLGCDMNVAVFAPPQIATRALPALYWLSGLTCTEQNFITKAGAQRFATEHGLVIVAPDTSPRGDDVPDDDAYDLGQGAGFYVDATRTPWSRHYRMYDYVVNELPGLIEAGFAVTDARGISGHSMGGHGALTIALKNPGRYRSVSAFAPIVGPSAVPWGEKAFGAYLGDDREAWNAYDACELVAGAEERLPFLIDQGTADGFLDEQLQPHRLEAACAAAGHPLELRMQAGYDHSYYFISTFIGDHVAHHARALCD